MASRLLAVYGGYFGAGSGVMTLALLLVMVERDLPTANALKNMLIGATTCPRPCCSHSSGPVHWARAAALGGGVLVGSRIGPAVPARGAGRDMPLGGRHCSALGLAV